MTHVRTSPYYPQSNGKMERWHQTLKSECIRPQTPAVRWTTRGGSWPATSSTTTRPPAQRLGLRHARRQTGRTGEADLRRAGPQAGGGPRRRKARRAAERPAGIDFAAVRRQISMEQVLRCLGHWDCLRGAGAQRRGPCPAHGSTHAGSRSFSVNLPKNVFRCFCPECGAKGNVLDLWAVVHGLPLAEAARHLAQTFGLDLPTGIREEEPVLPCIGSAAPCLTATTA